MTKVIEAEERQLALNPEKQLTHMDLLSLALHNHAAIDVIERLAALQREQMAREAAIDFNEALNRVQSEIKRIAPDMENPDKHNKWATYAAIDRVIRPVYSAEGFSLSFTHADCPIPEYARVVCRVSLRAHVEFYQIDVPIDTKGPKGGDVMTKTHAIGTSDSYGKRYLVKDIFNIAIGEDDVDGNGTNGELSEELDKIASCRNKEELRAIFKLAWNRFEESNPAALKAIVEAQKKRREEL